MNRGVLFTFCIAFAGCQVFAGTQAVMLFLSARDQPDTLGYNLVAQLPALLYEEIAAGDLPLWDSPEKQIRILPASLKRIEETKGLSFATSPQLFILEQWTIERKMLTAEISGFCFTDRTATGEEISYGYVDFHDAEMLLTSESILTNANGSCFSTFKFILLNHLYFYNIVQFGRRRISTLEESQKIKNQHEASLMAHVQPFSPSKKIAYLVEREPGADAAHDAATLLLDRVETYLNGNREVFLNFGGDRISDFRSRKPLRLRGLEAEEIWTRNDSGYDTQLLSVVLHMDSGSLSPMTQEEVWKLNIHLGDTPLPEVLKQKEFYFRILAVNSDRVIPDESQKYRRALQKYAWNRVKEYVRYE